MDPLLIRSHRLCPDRFGAPALWRGIDRGRQARNIITGGFDIGPPIREERFLGSHRVDQLLAGQRSGHPCARCHHRRDWHPWTAALAQRGKRALLSQGSAGTAPGGVEIASRLFLCNRLR